MLTKRILLHLILISLFFISNGQPNKWEYGFQGGINLNSAHGSSISKSDRSILTGLSIGGHLKLNTSQHFGIKVAPSYDTYGWAYRSLYLEDSVNGMVKADLLFKLNYINLPVLAEYSFGKKIKFNVNGGAFIGFLLSNKIVTQLKTPIPNRKTTTSYTSDYRKSLNSGIALGAGVQIPIASKINLDFNIRNSTGLSSIYKSNGTGNAGIKTTTFSILAGLTFKV